MTSLLCRQFYQSTVRNLDSRLCRLCWNVGVARSKTDVQGLQKGRKNLQIKPLQIGKIDGHSKLRNGNANKMVAKYPTVIADKEKIDETSEPGYTVRGQRLYGKSCSELLKNLSEAEEQWLLEFQIIHAEFKQKGLEVPEVLTDKMCTQLLQCDTRGQVKRWLWKFYEYEREQQLKQRSNKQKMGTSDLLREPLIESQVPYNSFIREYTVNEIIKSCHHRMVSAMMFGHPLIIDCSDSDVKHYTMRTLGLQLANAFSYNSLSRNPYHIMLTDKSVRLSTVNRLLDILCVSDESDLLVTTTDLNFADLFPHKELVYLTPFSTNVLKEFNPEDIYVIGEFGYVKRHRNVVSHRKTQRKNIRTAKLPINSYVSRHGGQITLEEVVKILVDMNNNSDWAQTLPKWLYFERQNKSDSSFPFEHNNEDIFSDSVCLDSNFEDSSGH